MPTPNTAMPYLSQGQANKEISHNQALMIIDVLMQGRVLDRNLSAPPGSPVDGAAYIVAAAPSGDWTGHADDIAFWMDESGVWQFITPLSGWQFYVVDEGQYARWTGTAWSTAPGLVLVSAADTITASTTQTQVGATAMTAQANRLTTVANVGDSVRIDYAAVVGAGVEILNAGANAAWIWPDTGDAIDGGAANARDANALAAGAVRRYRCFTAGMWRTV